MILALVLILVATLFRVAGTMDMALSNISPVMALAFCGAIYFKDRRLWLVPFIALTLSDLYINWFYEREYGHEWNLSGFLARTACFAAALWIGSWISQRKSWLWLLNGTLLGAILFYLVTNTQSWLTDAFYAKTLAGWWQALTVGHPEYPPTIYFFRNTLFGDLLFTGLFAGLMEWFAKEKGEPSLLDTEDEDEAAEETEPVAAGEEKPE